MWIQETLYKEHFYISADRWHSESAEDYFIPSRPPLFFERRLWLLFCKWCMQQLKRSYETAISCEGRYVF